MKTHWMVMRLCRWADIQAVEQHGLLPTVKFAHGLHGEFGYLPVFATRAVAEAASDNGRYPIVEMTSRSAEVSP